MAELLVLVGIGVAFGIVLQVWLEARRNVSTIEVVLARTSHHLLVLHGDVRHLDTLLGVIAIADIRSVEVGERSVLGERRSLLGLTLADATGMVLSSRLRLTDLTRRFADPLVHDPG